MVLVVAKVRTTLVLEDAVMAKLRQDFGSNLSAAVNSILKDALFKPKKDELFGCLKGRFSARDLVRDED